MGAQWNEMDLHREEDNLFIEWRDANRKKGLPFHPDGAMPDFTAEPTRVVFVLKEGNDPSGNWSAGGGI